MKRLLLTLCLGISATACFAQWERKTENYSPVYYKYYEYAIVKDGAIYMSDESDELYNAVLLRVSAKEHETFTIPEGVTQIAPRAFEGATIGNLCVPESQIRYVDKEAFVGSKILNFTVISSPTSVKRVERDESDEDSEEERYDMGGARLDSPRKGVNIVRTGGTIRKELVK